MQIKHCYSHLNGLEYLKVHKPELLSEIEQVIREIDVSGLKTKVSKEKTKSGKSLYNPKDINGAFKEAFRNLGWNEKRHDYYLTPDQELAYETMYLAKDKQKKAIEAVGKQAFFSYNQTDFLKDKVAIEVQFGKYSFVAYDLFVKHMAFYIANEINVGIEIIPTKCMANEMSSGVAYFEGEVYNVYRQGRNTPAVPLVLFGIEP